MSATTPGQDSAAAKAAELLHDARGSAYGNPEYASALALRAIGYALLALHEQGERRPEPAAARRWWRRGAR